VVEATITKLASRGYIRGRAMTVVNGGAARLLEEDHDDDHPHFASGDSDFDEGSEAAIPAEMIDVTAIGASVQAELAGGVTAQVTALEAAMSGSQGSRAQRAAEARMKGFEGDSCGNCGNFTLVRNGTCMKCNTCGSTTGCS
jgi:ribonucleoside-diphosphate reductase alpha chain